MGMFDLLRRQPYTRPFAGGRHPLDPPEESDDLLSQILPLLRREGAINLPTEEPPTLPPLRRELPNVAGAPALPAWNGGEVLTRDMAPERQPESLPLLTRNPVPVEYAPPPALAPFNRPPVMFGGRDDRPERVVAEGSNLDRALIRRQAVEDYQPKKESKKHLLARTLLNFVGGGIPGAAETLIGPGGVMDRRGLDRNWQANEMGQIDQNIARLGTLRRTGLQDRLLTAQVDRAENPPSPPPVDRTIGNTILRRQPDGSYKSVYEAPPKLNPPRRTGFNISPGQRRIELDENGNPKEVYVAAPDRPQRATGQETPQQHRERVGKFRAAKQLLDDLGQQEKAAAAAKDRALSEYQSARGRYPADADIQPDVIAARKAADDAQVRYEGFWSQKNKVKADLLEYGDVDESGNPVEPRQSEPLTRGASKPGPVKPARDGKYHYTPEQIRASLQPGQTYEDIYAKLKANPKVSIDEQ